MVSLRGAVAGCVLLVGCGGADTGALFGATGEVDAGRTERAAGGSGSETARGLPGTGGVAPESDDAGSGGRAGEAFDSGPAAGGAPSKAPPGGEDAGSGGSVPSVPNCDVGYFWAAELKSCVCATAHCGNGAGGALGAGGARAGSGGTGAGGAATCDLSLCVEPIPAHAVRQCSLAFGQAGPVTLCGFGCELGYAGTACASLSGAGGANASGGAPGAGGAPGCSAATWADPALSPCRCATPAECPPCGDSSPFPGTKPACVASNGIHECGCSPPTIAGGYVRACCVAGYAPQPACVAPGKGAIDSIDCPGTKANAVESCAPNMAFHGESCVSVPVSTPP